jgi:hypothetical protein
MSTAPKHDCPPCPKCDRRVASPAGVSERHISQAPNHLYCPACGHEWLEADAVKVVQAWWSRGAYDGETREHAWAEIEWRIMRGETL